MGDFVRFDGCNRFSRVHPNEGLVRQIVQQALAWEQTATALVASLPAFLRERCRAVCVRDDGTLVWHALDNAAAARLRMMLPTLLAQWTQLDNRIVAATVKIRLPEAARQKVKRARVSQTAAQHLRQTADSMSAHPKLAMALRRLADKADDDAA